MDVDGSWVLRMIADIADIAVASFYLRNPSLCATCHRKIWVNSSLLLTEVDLSCSSILFWIYHVYCRRHRKTLQRESCDLPVRPTLDGRGFPRLWWPKGIGWMHPEVQHEGGVRVEGLRPGGFRPSPRSQEVPGGPRCESVSCRDPTLGGRKSKGFCW